MIIYRCDKCESLSSEDELRIGIKSNGRSYDLCRICRDELTAHMETAKEQFFQLVL